MSKAGSPTIRETASIFLREVYVRFHKKFFSEQKVADATGNEFSPKSLGTEAK